MLFSQDPTAVLCISREGLVLYNKKGASRRLALEPEVMHNLEVIDRDQLGKVVGMFATENSLRGQRVVILLDESVLFQKITPKAPEANVHTLAAEFENKVPFDPENRKVIALQPKDQLVLLGANKLMYETVAAALIATGAKVLAVAPLAVFSKGREATLAPSDVSAILSDYRLARAANFLQAS
jgi:hypothetical protein